MVSKRERREVKRASAKAWATQPDQGESTCVKLPEGFEWFKPKAGQLRIDILPYVMGEGNPAGEAGYQFFQREYARHAIPGLDGKSRQYCCLYATFREACPVCEYLNRNGGTMDKALADGMRAKTRHLFNVIDLDSRDRKVTVWEQPHGSAKHPFFGQLLKNKLAAVETYQDFWLPTRDEGGMTLVVTAIDDSFEGGSKYVKATNIELVPRKDDYDDDIVDRTCCLDDCLVHTPADKLEELLLGTVGGGPRKASSIKKDHEGHENGRAGKGDGEDHDEGEEPAPKGKKQKTAAQLGISVGDRVEKGGREYDVLKISSDGTSLVLENASSGKELRGVDPNDCTLLNETEEEPEEEEEEERPAKKGAKAKAAEPDDEDEDDLDDEPDDEDEEEEETPKRKPAGKPNRKGA